jgi:4-hydroxy-tetrahydrodipicolinate reductase
MTRVILAGATGWAGSELARGIAATDDIQLVAGVARKAAGTMVNDAPIYATAEQALAKACDVFVEYTRADSALGHIRSALNHGVNVVVGSSGITDAQYADIHELAKTQGRAVLACGNFALTMVLLQKFATMAAKYIPTKEIIDYAYLGKPDAPSGTARELASRIGADTPIHSVRLPGFVLGAEVIFGMPDQTLSMRHDAGASAKPYVDGALLAIRKVATLAPGLHRGLDAVLDL